MFHYTNRKGVTYYLHASRRRDGQVRYTMKRSDEGALAELPEGYEVVESVNAQVSVRRPRPRWITEREQQAVQAALDQNNLDTYRFEIRAKRITIFEPDTNPNELIEELYGESAPPLLSEDLDRMLRDRVGAEVYDAYRKQQAERYRENILTRTHYSPVLRFTLIDPKSRRFLVERMVFRGEEHWHELDRLGLDDALSRYIPHLGRESFFDLI